MKSAKHLFFALVVLGLLTPGAPAYAYLDPGTGSMIVQILLGGVAGALVVGKLYWARIQAIFGRRPPEDKRDAATDINAD